MFFVDEIIKEKEKSYGKGAVWNAFRYNEQFAKGKAIECLQELEEIGFGLMLDRMSLSAKNG